MVPSPESWTGSQARSWHAGQNSRGGSASSPHRAQRIPVRRPSRARSKNPLSVITGSVTAEQAHQDGRGVAAQGVDEARAGALDLPGAGLAAELGDDLGHLGGAGGPDGVALGLEAAGRVDRDLAAQRRPALLGRDAARARLEEPEPLGG